MGQNIDTFVGSAAADLNTHTSDSGYAPSYFTLGGIFTGHFLLDGAGKCYQKDSNSPGVEYNWTPASADYSAQLDVVCGGGTIGVNTEYGLSVRLAGGQNDRYDFVYFHGNWLLIARVSGGSTTLGTQAVTLANNTTYTMYLEAVGTAIKAKVSVNGGAFTTIFSVTDNTVTQTGQPWIVWASDAAGQGSSANVKMANYRSADISAGSLAVAPTTIPANHSGNITLTLTGSSTAWTGSTVFTPSGVSGVTKVSQNVTSGTAATLVITTGSSTGTLTVTESVTGTASGTCTISAATISVVPTSGNNASSFGITLTGTNTLWATDHPTFTVAGVAGASLSAISWGSNTSASATMTTGGATGTATITDPSTGATCTFTIVNNSTLPSAPTISISTAGGNDTVSITVASTQGTNPLGGYKLYAGSTPGGESSTPVATMSVPGSVPAAFAAQPTAAAGATKFYVAKAFDNQGSPNFSVASNEVFSKTTSLTTTGTTYKHASAAGYGSSSAGLSNIGYTVYDPVGAVLISHTTSGVSELPDASTGHLGITGIYVADITLDIGWRGVILWDAPSGGSPVYEVFEQQPQDMASMAVYDRVQASPSPATTAFAGSSALSSSNSFYVGSLLVFQSGANKGIAKKIAGYVGSTRTFSTAAFPATPSAGDSFLIVGQGA